MKNTLTRRAFAQQLLAMPAVLPSVSSALAAAAYGALGSSASAAAGDAGLEKAARELLRDEVFFDCAACDRFYRYPTEKPMDWSPDRILPYSGGGVLGIGHLTPEVWTQAHDPKALGKPGEVTHTNILGLSGAVQEILREFASMRRMVAAHSDKAGIAGTPEEMVALRQAGKVALVPGLDTGNETGGDPLVLEELYRLGLRKMAMCHEAPTPFSGSDTSDTQLTPGLNPLGRTMIAECNRLGIMVDVSHSNDRTFWGVLEHAKRPVIATHSGARGRLNARRNLDDKMLRALVKTGGMVGVGGYTSVWYARLAEKGYYRNVAAISRWMIEKYPDPIELARALKDPAKMAEANQALGLPRTLPGSEMLPKLIGPESTMEHLDYMLKVVGIDHIGIGTDLAFDTEDYRQMLLGVASGMLQRNFSSEQMRKILRDNLLRVFKDNSGPA